MRVVVYHTAYGCETGCCGHVIQMDDGAECFMFAHPYGEDVRGFAERIVRDAGCDPADIDWESCRIIDGEDCP
jgi:hypothetical protein